MILEAPTPMPTIIAIARMKGCVNMIPLLRIENFFKLLLRIPDLYIFIDPRSFPLTDATSLLMRLQMEPIQLCLFLMISMLCWDVFSAMKGRLFKSSLFSECFFYPTNFFLIIFWPSWNLLYWSSFSFYAKSTAFPTGILQEFWGHLLLLTAKYVNIFQ